MSVLSRPDEPYLIVMGRIHADRRLVAKDRVLNRVRAQESLALAAETDLSTLRKPNRSRSH